ncbi:MAG: polysaccharide biosynthesis protein, partial [Bacteroidales bacterium]
MKRSIFFILIIFMSFSAFAETEYKPEFSTAGFFKLHGSGRDIYSMNPAWRFHKGALSDAQARDYNDRGWSVVSLPNGIEYLPTEASGCINYQGEVWYRKHFIPSDTLKGKKLFLHFEAIMGKSKVFVNGKSVAKSFGGYLPIVVDITDVIEFGKDNIIAVWADNSNDPSYPPGKAQDVLDFAYFGGIYRDCWLIACNDIYITDPNYEKEVAGGGLFVAYDKVSEASAEMLLQLHLRNDGQKLFSGTVWYEVLQPDGKRVALSHEKFKIDAEKSVTVKDKILLITGAGSFGNAVLRRFLDSDIKEIRIFSRDEKKQDDMRHEFQSNMPEVAGKIKFFIGDVRDLASVKNAMHGVDYIFHAAALKQVPSCEFYPMEAVRTNVLGT